MDNLSRNINTRPKYEFKNKVQTERQETLRRLHRYVDNDLNRYNYWNQGQRNHKYYLRDTQSEHERRVNGDTNTNCMITGTGERLTNRHQCMVIYRNNRSEGNQETSTLNCGEKEQKKIHMITAGSAVSKQ